jgi:hypothetical protein
MWEELHFSPPLLCSLCMLRREIRLRFCVSVVINVYTSRTDRRNTDLKTGSTSRYLRRMTSDRGRFDIFQWMMNIYFVKVLGDAIHFLVALQVSRFSLFIHFRISDYCLVGCDFVVRYRCFIGACFFQRLGRISTLRVETTFFSETVIFIGKTTRRHKPQHSSLNEHRH